MNESVFMEIHDEAILSDFNSRNTKKGLAPLFAIPNWLLSRSDYLCCYLFLTKHFTNKWPEEQ